MAGLNLDLGLWLFCAVLRLLGIIETSYMETRSRSRTGNSFKSIEWEPLRSVSDSCFDNPKSESLAPHVIYVLFCMERPI